MVLGFNIALYDYELKHALNARCNSFRFILISVRSSHNLNFKKIVQYPRIELNDTDFISTGSAICQGPLLPPLARVCQRHPRRPLGHLLKVRHRQEQRVHRQPGVDAAVPRATADGRGEAGDRGEGQAEGQAEGKEEEGEGAAKERGGPIEGRGERHR